MSKLSKLCGKLKQEVVLGEGEDATTIILKTPKVKDLTELVELFKDDKEEMNGKKLETIINILTEQLKQEDPEATEEEINEVITTNLPVLVEALTKLLTKAFDSKKK